MLWSLRSYMVDYIHMVRVLPLSNLTLNDPITIIHGHLLPVRSMFLHHCAPPLVSVELKRIHISGRNNISLLPWFGLWFASIAKMCLGDHGEVLPTTFLYNIVASHADGVLSIATNYQPINQGWTDQSGIGSIHLKSKADCFYKVCLVVYHPDCLHSISNRDFYNFRTRSINLITVFWGLFRPQRV